MNGYQELSTAATQWNQVVKSAGQTVDALKSLTNFEFGEMKFPETKIGETVTKAEDWAAAKLKEVEIKIPPPPAKPVAVPPKIPFAPRARIHRR